MIKINQLSFFEKENLSDNLFKKFEDIHNYLYANEGLSEQQILEEMIKILFIKFYDEQRNNSLFYISKTEFLNINSEKTKNLFFNRINQLFKETKETYHSYFEKNDILKLNISSLAFSIKKLQNITFKNSNTDEGGLAFQKFIGRYSRESRGQFFTPDPVIDVCVGIIQPKKNEKIIDPACGTGGFLSSSLRYIKQKYKNLDIQSYIQNNLYGIEINPRISQIAKIKFLIESNVSPKILCSNALDSFKELNLKHNITLSNQFDIILTNPPFGSQGKITNNELLLNYQLGHKWFRNNNNIHEVSQHILKGQTPEILFIEKCFQLLRPGGKMGIVLPNGHLENSSLEYLRAYIKTRMDILGVILLPQDTFIPYGTGVKTSLLFLRKKDKKLKNDKVFFSQIKKIGYAGNKSKRPLYKKDDYGNTLIDEDYSKVMMDYNQFLKKSYVKSSSSFCIKSEKLNKRFDYTYHLPTNRKLVEQLKQLNSINLYKLVDIVKGKSKFLNNQIVNYIELSDIYTQSFEIINSTSLAVNKLPSRASYEIKTGDIITAVSGNAIGTYKHTTAYVTEEFDKSICTNGFRVLRNFKINPFYLLYYFQSDLFLKQVFMYRTGAAIPALSDEDFSNILVYIPPKKEVEQISSVVKKSFYLRQKAKNEMKSITLTEINP